MWSGDKLCNAWDEEGTNVVLCLVGMVVGFSFGKSNVWLYFPRDRYTIQNPTNHYVTSATMIAEPPTPPPAPTMAAFQEPADHDAPLPGASHGQKATVDNQCYKTPIKIEFNVPGSQTAFNLNKAHQVILRLLKDKDPTLEIIPSKKGAAKFFNLL
jgi:hypothetical protein